MYEGLEEEDETGVGLGESDEFGGDEVVLEGWVENGEDAECVGRVAVKGSTLGDD